jgi:outer membrane cobalamin receptor
MRASLDHRVLILACSPIALMLACKTFHPARVSDRSDADRIVITEEKIARSGGQTAWEVLRREAPQLTFRENRNGQATEIVNRGRSSILLNDTPMLIVDGVRSPDIKTLQQIPASTLASIEVLSGTEGTTYYGTDAVGGVILVRTKNGSSQ